MLMPKSLSFQKKNQKVEKSRQTEDDGLENINHLTTNRLGHNKFDARFCQRNKNRKNESNLHTEPRVNKNNGIYA